MKASHLGSFSSRSTLPPALLIFLSLFSNSFQGKKKQQKNGGRRRKGRRGENESGTPACDNCHAEWTSPLFIGF